ncbi:MAG: TonB-dependent receptor [Chryseolinea sp.]
MTTSRVPFTIGFFISLLILAAQTGFGQAKYQISGTVIDSTASSPLAFATVRILKVEDKSFAGGSLTSDAGEFSISVPEGKYYAEIGFMGYHSQRSKPFMVSKTGSTVTLGKIMLGVSARTLDEVIVQAEKSSMELSLDKKIFNVGQDLANAGGSASDILTNIPSVSVDPEGTIKLRGSDNVRILIDGKPSGLVSFKGGSGLQQLQASMIERVEVITNPSARYEAEGMAGIINIVLKKDRHEGFNGSFDVIAGHPINYGGAANVNFRHRKVNFFVNYSIAYRETPSRGSQYQEVYGGDGTTKITQQTTDGYITGFNNNIRGGLDYFFNEKSILTASYLYRRSDAGRVTHIRYEDFTNSITNPVGYTLRKQDENEVEPNSEYSLIYKKSFQEKGHEFTGEVKYLDNWESSKQTFTQTIYANNGTPQSGTIEKAPNDESEKQFLVQLDYTKPVWKDGKFEAGVRTSFRDMVNDYVVYRQNEQGGFDPLPGLDNIFVYNENIHAAYAILGNKTRKFSYQAGLRTEWTDVKTTLKETNDVNPRKYTNLFPSVHATMELQGQNALQVSYSRRVRRPFYNDLSPFMTYADSRNYFSGNPDLNPEFSNVYEVGHIKYFEQGTFTSSVYFRDTDGKIDRIRTVDAQTGLATTLPQNLKGEKAYGIEFTSSLTPVKWWKIDGNFNFFHSKIDGSNIMDSYRATTYSWFARLTSRFTVAKIIDVQLRGNYEAPQKSAQGRRKSLSYMDFSMSKDILKGRGTLNLNILDVFNSRKMRTITQGEDFYTAGNYQFRRRQINLTFSYRIKQNKGAAKAAKLED